MPEGLTYLGDDTFVLDEDTDGPYVPDQGEITITFRELHNPPTLGTPPPGPGTLVEAGDYNAAVFLSGFNESGGAFLKTVDLGLVHIIDCGP